MVGNYASPDFVELLKNKIIPQLEADLGHKNFTYQQDNASIHNTELILNFLEEKELQY